MPRLEDYLVLNRYMHHLLGAEDFETLKNLLRPLPEGPDGGGCSHFLGRLVTQPNLKIQRDRLEMYDRRVMDYEAGLRRERHDFQAFRYFQYLALLYTEIFLDKLTADPVGFVAEINVFLDSLRHTESELSEFPDFGVDGLRRLAFFMATGSGKTLLMHVNIRQILHYLEHGGHPEALLPGKRQERSFDNILLITPNEGLSAQHLSELRASGLDAVLFIEDPYGKAGLFGPKVKVIEIHKLAEEPSREGVSVVLEEIGQNNLVIVDEGHKGTGSEAQTWKTRQKYLSEGGFLLEYSATFAQAIAAVGRRNREQLLQEYGQAILFDYSYAHFYSDGYGKDFAVLNLQDSRPDQAHELLVGGLLTFYHQLYLYQQNQDTYRHYNIEKPLWVLLGSSVNALYTQDRTRRSDVAEVMAFIKRFVEDSDWAVGIIERILRGDSGFQDSESGQDLFEPYIRHLRQEDAEALYHRMLRDVFHGTGGLEIWELKQTDGEFGLRLSTSDEKAPYFGVINIGDTSEFKKYLGQHLDIEVKADNFRPSLFDLIDRPDSPVYLLIGAKKFIEGWSSWRVASMGLLNVGKGAGPQIIQLFGRGVRLKGKDMCLKRSAALGGDGHPEGIRFLETLTIFGWNANYIQTFRKIIDNEDLGKEFELAVKKMEPWPEDRLPVPQKKANFDVGRFTWILDTSGPSVELDLTPRLQAFATGGGSSRIAEIERQLYGSVPVRFCEYPYSHALNYESLYLEALAYKEARSYENLLVTPRAITDALRQRCIIKLFKKDCSPRFLQQAATDAVKTYIDRFVRMKEREAESRHMELNFLTGDDPRVLDKYYIRVRGAQLAARIEEQIRRIEALIRNGHSLYDDGEPLPRLHFDRSLFNPILVEGRTNWRREVSIQPSPLNRDEQQFVRDLRRFWQEHHEDEEIRELELYVLRNLSRTGISLFHRSEFYPDFILWLHHRTENRVYICFVDPHGLHHAGLRGNHDKFAALRALTNLTSRPEFQRMNAVLTGFLLTKTRIDQIVDAEGRSEDDLEAEYPLIFQTDNYVERLFKRIGVIGEV